MMLSHRKALKSLREARNGTVGTVISKEYLYTPPYRSGKVLARDCPTCPKEALMCDPTDAAHLRAAADEIDRLRAELEQIMRGEYEEDGK